MDLAAKDDQAATLSSSRQSVHRRGCRRRCRDSILELHAGDTSATSSWPLSPRQRPCALLSDQARNNTIDNFRLVFDGKFLQTIITRVDAIDDIYKKIHDDEDLRGSVPSHGGADVTPRTAFWPRRRRCAPLRLPPTPC